MMQYASTKSLFNDLMNKEIEYIDAIEVLTEQFNYNSKDAEELVSYWEETKRFENEKN